MATTTRAGPLAGKTVVVTGANSGIGASQPPHPPAAVQAGRRGVGWWLTCGAHFACSPAATGFETAAELAARGASVVLACRRMQAAEDAASAIRCVPC